MNETLMRFFDVQDWSRGRPLHFFVGGKQKWRWWANEFLALQRICNKLRFFIELKKKRRNFLVDSHDPGAITCTCSVIWTQMNPVKWPSANDTRMLHTNANSVKGNGCTNWPLLVCILLCTWSQGMRWSITRMAADLQGLVVSCLATLWKICF